MRKIATIIFISAMGAFAYAQNGTTIGVSSNSDNISNGGTGTMTISTTATDGNNITNDSRGNRPANDNPTMNNGENMGGAINNNSSQGSSSGNITPNINTNNGTGIFNNGFNNSYNYNGNNNGYNYNYNGYNNGYNYNGYNTYNNNGYNTYNNTGTNNNNNNQNYGTYTNTGNDGYGSTVIMDDGNGEENVIVNTNTGNNNNTQIIDNDAPIIEERINNHYVHFSGLVMSDIQNRPHNSKAYVDDDCSDMLTPGKYHRIKNYLTKSTKTTFDGIAVAPGTRLIIYSKPNFKGNILVDVTGPAIINNKKWQNDSRYIPSNTKTYIQELQGTFPQSVRQWSVSNMHKWQNGSIEIIELQ